MPFICQNNCFSSFVASVRVLLVLQTAALTDKLWDGVVKESPLPCIFQSFFSNCSILVFTVKYPCGKVLVKRTKRSIVLPTNSSTNATSDQDVPSMNETSLEEDFATTTESPTPPPRNRSRMTDPNVDTRIVGGDECKLGECPWQVSLMRVILMETA